MLGPSVPQGAPPQSVIQVCSVTHGDGAVEQLQAKWHGAVRRH